MHKQKLNYSILVADDNPVDREMLRTFFETEGYSVATAVDGEETLASFTQTAPDLLLLDLDMPKIDGYEVCRCVRADPKIARIPIIVITVYGDSESVEEAFRAGADDVIAKPIP